MLPSTGAGREGQWGLFSEWRCRLFFGRGRFGQPSRNTHHANTHHEKPVSTWRRNLYVQGREDQLRIDPLVTDLLPGVR
jgi:hypothetical protein